MLATGIADWQVQIVRVRVFQAGMRIMIREHRRCRWLFLFPITRPER
jgi:hypothetical protein